MANGPATPVVIDLTTPETIDPTGDDDLKPQLNAQKQPHKLFQHPAKRVIVDLIGDKEDNKKGQKNGKDRSPPPVDCESVDLTGDDDWYGA